MDSALNGWQATYMPVRPNRSRSSDGAPPQGRDFIGIERIDSLQHPGVFHDLTWPSDLAAFRRRNLIYGWNGSGKTTLSNILRALQDHESPSGCQVTMSVSGHKVRGNQFPEQTIPVRVFNRKYVQETVFPTGGGDLPLILILGKENVEQQRRLEQLRPRLQLLNQELESAKKEERTAKSALDTFYTDQATKIREPLRIAGGAYNNYDKGDFSQRLGAMIKANDAASHLLTEDQKNTALVQHRGTPKEELPTISFAVPDWNSLAKDVSAALAKSVTTNAIASLRDDPKLAAWVQEGLLLHQEHGSERCLYCEQPLPEERANQLESHFSQAYKLLEDELAALSARIAMSTKAVDAIMLPNHTQLHDDLAVEYRPKSQRLEEQLAELRVGLEDLQKQLGEKRKRPFEAMSAKTAEIRLKQDAIDSLNELLQRHNKACSSFADRAIKAREQLEAASVAAAIPRYGQLSQEVAATKTAVERKRAEQESVQKELSEAERGVVEHMEPVARLNEDLRGYLGHSELSLQASDSGYILMRGREVARGLSEGEETAIALLYFLRSLEDKSFDFQRGVVVLDDPVSSLDANAIFLAFGFIRASLESVGQLFILTHNFSFFRLVRGWCYDHRQRKPWDDCSLYMLETSLDGSERSSVIAALDPLLNDYESEYHYLFDRVVREAHASAKNSLEERYALPNVARRLIEAFLAFRRPAMGSLEKKIMAMKGGDRAQKLRVLRFLHVQSHGDALPEPEHDLSHLAETPAVLNDLLDLIKQEDPEHYAAMLEICKATDPIAPAPESAAEAGEPQGELFGAAASEARESVN